MTTRAPVLVIGIGNPSRGDDAIGPLAIERLAALGIPGVELLTDFQLQVEHALDIADRIEVVFVDACVDAGAPFTFTRVHACPDASSTTHALSPAAVLDTCARLGERVPAARVLAVSGHAFELGAPLSDRAAQNLDAAVAMLAARLAARVITSLA
jgi:hydrogenase maturation protease